MIDEPGVYEIPEEDYHADPVKDRSLSSSGARRLLPPSCPAKFKHELDYPEVKRVFDLGRGAHRMVLGTGPDIDVIEAPDYRTAAARQRRDDAHAAGVVPLLEHEHEQMCDMAAALRRHSIAKDLFKHGGRAEQTLIWQDAPTGVWRRARLDWLPDKPGPHGRLVIVDYKTCRSASPDVIPGALASYGYHMQGAWYADGVRALGLAKDAAFCLVMQEKDPPYLVTVAQVDAIALSIGRDLNRRALQRYKRCRETGQWPGYVDPETEPAVVALPSWYEKLHRQEMQ